MIFFLFRSDLTNNGMQLTLRMVNRRDAGIYECTATNGVGQDAKEVIELQVLCKYTFNCDNLMGLS